MATSDRLDSWKEIARYLNRSVRTVRRWERQEGLPVHRHMHRSLASVFAVRSEIDAWRHRRVTAAMADDLPTTATPSRSRSIAVLPFLNLSTDADNAYFAEGLTEELITTLSRIHALRVTSRRSSASLRGSTKGARAIARQLGVRYLLEGSVRRTATHLRISVQLIDASSDVNLWSETYDGALEDVFTIQERCARSVVTALELRLTARDAERLAEPAIPSLPAYDCYLRARYEGWRWRRASIDQAIRLLQQALQIIGENIRLLSALGLAHLQYREAGLDLSEHPLVEAERCAAKVFALDPSSAAGFQLRGWIQYSRGHIQSAVRNLKRSLAQEPHSADTLLLLCNCYLISGRVTEARPLLARLLRVDPLTPITRCMPAFADLMEGKFSVAIRPYQQMLEMDPANPVARLFYIWVLILNRRSDQAKAILANFPHETLDSIPARVASFLTRAAAGDHLAAQLALTPQIESVAKATDMFPRFLAQGFAWAGMRVPALKWLRTAIDRGFINYPFLARHDPSFKALRGDPKFKELLAVVRDRWERFAA
jgi:TolB-like protein/thioredoxin-like negative regulator of GroEL